MKYNFLTLMIGLFLSCHLAHSQMVNETVNFDNYISASDNDFINRFDNGPGLNQIQNNGITGGCLTTPQTESWGNDNAIYCTHFKGQVGVSYTTGICFKYDTTNLNSINFDRPVTISMKPYVDQNHYVIASVMGSGNIQIVSYSAAASSPVLQLDQDHWYNLLLTTVFTGGAANDQIDINAQVNDLGVTGNDPPIPTGFTNAVLHDSFLIADTAIESSISGTQWGGALYLDNFRFDGLKSFDNCVSTALNEITNDNLFDFYLSVNKLIITTDKNFSKGEMEIDNVNGQRVFSSMVNSGKTEFDLSFLTAGFYFLSLKNKQKAEVKKFVLVK
ncbi:hypothetical protein BH11BAC1_BH11BAC1_28110 [soil metagenome]